MTVAEVEAMNDGETLARAVGEAMYARDRVGRRLGMQVEEIRAGYVRIVMQVDADMINGHGICHGGSIFTLADAACAYACNSRNQNSLAQSINIVFLTPAHLGERLVAEATETAQAGRTGTYDIRITGNERRVVAMALAQSRTVSGHWVDSPPADVKPT